MAISVRGLNVRRQYEDLIGVAFSDGLGNIKFPNRCIISEKWLCFKPVRWRRYENNVITTRSGKQRII